MTSRETRVAARGFALAGIVIILTTESK